MVNQNANVCTFATLKHTYYGVLYFLEESPSRPYPAGNYAFQSYDSDREKEFQCLPQTSELYLIQTGGLTVTIISSSENDS